MSEILTFYALLDDNNIVSNTFVMSHEKAATGIWGNPERLVEYTNYTVGGVYTGDENITPLRYNTPGIGYSYILELDAFVPPKPYPSWLLNTNTCQWQAPIPYPNDGKPYIWDEETQSWVPAT